jgi:hypothetical protein
MADGNALVDLGALPHFEHVVIVNAPITQSRNNESLQGLRAFKDADTGLLRAPTPDEMQTMAGQRPVAKARTGIDTRMQAFALDKGGVGVELDESTLQYSVIVRQEDGSLAEVCVTGVEKADEIVKAQPKQAARKETLNDR